MKRTHTQKIVFIILALIGFSIEVFAQARSRKDQYGDHNQAIVTQTGDHDSQVLQKSTATSSAEQNLVTITQKDIISPIRTGSNVIVKQYGNSHTTTVIQTGKNQLESYIGANGTPNANNETSAKQYGLDNVGKQSILASAGANSVLILIQNGTGNSSTQTAHSTIASTGYVAQSGIENISLQQIEGEGNQASITQLNDYNYSYQSFEGQISSGNSITVKQAGDENSSSIVTSGQSNLFNLQQIGDGNNLVGLSGDPASSAIQNGHLNKTSLLQNGNSNEIRLEQGGNSNTIRGPLTSSATQYGNENLKTLSQNGEGLQIKSAQYGTFNSENVIQTGSLSTSKVIQNGDFNTTVIRQRN
jgi:hypothetical protein